MNIKKRDMASRVSKAVDSTPDINARLKHARDLASAHPMRSAPSPAETPPVHTPPVETPSVETPSVIHKPEKPASGKCVAVPIGLIDANPHNARRIYRPERVSDLAASIGAHGQDVPGIATYRDGRYILAAGHYRLRALKVLGSATMDLMIHDALSDKDLFAYSYRENAEREGQSALDNALCWRELLDSGLYSSETELAEVTGMSLPNINKTLRILKLSDAVLDLVKEDPAVFALTSLYELALFETAAPPGASLELARQIKAGDAGRKEVQEARAKLEHPKTRKTKETSRQYKIHRSGQSVGFVKAWDSGRVALDVVITDPAERNEVLEILKTRFGITE